ncbi:PHP domain-containing protein [Acidiferrimicrobium sp. IK]|nr:PHP domain-containing protein [Acidiferrimicrobium sp. IK]
MEADNSTVAAAFERIAYLLERSREPTYRVRAFRTAAAAVRTAGPERVADLVARGRLTDLAGIGPSTAKVAAEVLGGAVPAYLQRLEDSAEPEGPQDRATAELVGALRGDLHAHSDWSDGGSPIEEMARAAADLGHAYLAMTDHSPRLTVAHGLDAGRLERQLDVIAQLNAAGAGVCVLTGIEVDILEDGSLDQTDELLDRLDVVVASVHSKLRMDHDAMTERMVVAATNPRVDVLGHCTGRIVVGKGRPPSSFDPDAVFEACARNRTAVEINSRPERLDPPDELLRVANGAGCVFSIDTDAHAPGQLEWQRYGAAKAVAAGIPAARILNTGPLEDIREWGEM